MNAIVSGLLLRRDVRPRGKPVGLHWEMHMDRILIIQDSPTINAMLKSRLESDSFAVDTTETAEEGIEKAKSRQHQLILMDITLPRMDGLEATRILKKDETTNHIPVVLMSARDEEELSQNAKDVCADGYIRAPFEGKEFLKKVKGFIGM